MSADHERITTVKFLRKQAKDAGDLKTPRGQALHKAAGHLVRLQEELDRLAALAAAATPESTVEFGAQGIHRVFETEMAATRPGYPGQAWESLNEEAREQFRQMCRGALGWPIVERAMDDADAA